MAPRQCGGEQGGGGNPTLNTADGRVGRVDDAGGGVDGGVSQAVADGGSGGAKAERGDEGVGYTCAYGSAHLCLQTLGRRHLPADTCLRISARRPNPKHECVHVLARRYMSAGKHLQA
jgi:hypothetical protein